MGFWDGYPGTSGVDWETAQPAVPAFLPVPPVAAPEPPKSPPWVPAPPAQKLPDIVAEPYAAPSQPRQPSRSFRSPAEYWGIDEKTAGTLPLGLRHSNNLFNIKYFKGAERNPDKWPGLMGPSVARDQGDPQMLFRDPEDSGVAAAGLLRRKYDSGMRTPRQIIAGQMGWTPGRVDSAAAVAKYAGVGLDDDLNLKDPAALTRFMKALATQEHGTWARDQLFAKQPDLFERITQRYLGGPTPEGGQMAPASNPSSPGPVASASPSRSKPMPDTSGGGFFSFLSKPMDLFGNPQNADILNRAGPQGYQPVDGDAFLAKHGLANTPGAKEMVAIANMQRELLGGALQPPQATWGQGIGEALKGVGAVLSSRVDPKLGLQMAGTVGQSHREQQELVRKMQMQALLQQASSLGGDMSDLIKTKIAKDREQADWNAGVDRFMKRPPAVGTGTVAPGSASVGAVTRQDIPPISSATAAPTVPGTGAAPQTAVPPSGAGATAVPGTAAAQPSAASGVPGLAAPGPSEKVRELRERGQAAIAAGPKFKDLAKAYLDEADHEEKQDLKRWELDTEAQRKAAETTAVHSAKVAGDEAAKRVKANENAQKMADLFGSLEKHGRVKGIESVIGPFDNTYIGRRIADMNVFSGPTGEDAGVRSLIEGDMAALAAIAKNVTRVPGEGNFTDADQKLLIDAIGSVLDAPNAEAYQKAVKEAKSRAEKLLGVKLPETSVGKDETKKTSVEKAGPLSVTKPEDLMNVPENTPFLFRGVPHTRQGTKLVPVAAAQPAAAPQPVVNPTQSRMAQENPAMTPQQRYQQAQRRMWER